MCIQLNTINIGFTVILFYSMITPTTSFNLKYDLLDKKIKILTHANSLLHVQ